MINFDRGKGLRNKEKRCWTDMLYLITCIAVNSAQFCQKFKKSLTDDNSDTDNIKKKLSGY